MKRREFLKIGSAALVLAGQATLFGEEKPQKFKIGIGRHDLVVCGAKYSTLLACRGGHLLP